MSAEPPTEPPPEPPPEPRPGPGPPTAGEGAGPAHDPSGGELARAIARAYRGVGRRRARGRRPGGRTTPQASGARPDDRDPQPLDATVSRLVAEHGWGTDLAVHGLFGRWDTLVGAEVAAHCRPERFVDGRLVVRADSTAWATQVRLLAPAVLERLNTELGEGTVRQVDVAGPQAPSWRHGRFSVRGTRGPRDTYG